MTRGKAESFEQSAFANSEQITQEILQEIETVRPELAEILSNAVCTETSSELDHLSAMVAPDEAAYALAVVERVLGRRGFFLNDGGAS